MCQDEAFIVIKNKKPAKSLDDFILRKIFVNTLKHCVSAIMLVCLASACTESNSINKGSGSTQQEKQNIVMIIVDDLRPVIGAYGDDKAHTPNIDALAEQGVTFKYAYANVPVCGASRASMLTGLRPTKDRFIDYKAMAEKDVPGAKSLPQVLRESGYYTMAIGKIFHTGRDLADVSWSEKIQTAGLSHATALNPDSANFIKPSRNPNGRGNGPWYETADVADEAYPDGKVKQKALVALTKLAAKEQPFFLGVGFIRPHLPFYAPQKYYDLHPKEKFSPFFHRTKPELAPDSLRGSNEIGTYHFKDYQYNSDEFHLSSVQGYYASVSYIDSLIGDVVQKIDSLGIRENTTIVMLSDHGFQLGEHNFWTKHTMLDTSLRVPMIVSNSNMAKNQQTNALVELIDVFPTLAEITQIVPPTNLAGESFTDVLKNPELPHKNQIYSRFKKGDSVVSSDFIFTSYTTEDNQIEEMLFDHQKDPHETKNVVNEPNYQKVAATLRTQLNDCMAKQECRTH